VTRGIVTPVGGGQGPPSPLNLVTLDVYVYNSAVPLDALENPLVLPVLGLLVEKPAHAYDLAARLAERYPRLEVRRSSVRTLTRSLEAAGLIEARPQRRVGKRPARTEYELTEAGYDHVRRRILHALESARAGSRTLLLALSYVGLLPKDVAATALASRLASLHDELKRATVGHSLPEYQMLEISYWSRLLAAEIDWIEQLAMRLTEGTLAWPTPARPSGAL
jgi:DNA-binding PadR family transcriptional regulator